jgi:catechol 2,3-dioxygenase-like lactoylglutathione lyase family enzyme
MTSAGNADMKLEVVVIPVSDVDRAKRFYADLGWRLDADFAGGDWRVIQFTPPGPPTSVICGKNVTAAVPGSAQGLYLIVSDIEAARADLVRRGVEVSEIFHGGGDEHGGPDEPYIFGRLRVSGPDPKRASYSSFGLVPRSRRQWLAVPGNHGAPAWTRRCRHDVHLFGRTVEGVAACGGRAWRA